jgi:hypothetical protein
LFGAGSETLSTKAATLRGASEWTKTHAPGEGDVDNTLEKKGKKGKKREKREN